MTRKIKAKDIKPGMTIEWKHGGYYTRCVVGLVKKENLSYPAYSIRAVGSAAGWKTFNEGQEVTVLKEAQPEEPTEFGAKVVVNERRFIRTPEWGDGYCVWLESGDGTWHDWDDLLRMGQVTVVPDLGWTVPDDDDDTLTPEVPDRIKKWPEDDIHLREYRWRDVDGDVWVYVNGAWRWGSLPYGDYETPINGPWTRVDEAGE